MRSVCITCPECSKTIEYNVLADINICGSCGFTTDVDEETVRDKTLKSIESELRAQLKKPFDPVSITEICDRILGRDVHNSDAWMYKGMAADSLPEKTACYYNAVRYMDGNEFNDIYNTMSDDLSVTIDKYEGEWDALDIARIDYLFRMARPEGSKKDDFILEVMNKLKKIVLKCENTFAVKVGYSSFLSLAIATMMLYQDITIQAGTLESAIDDMDEMARKFARDVPEEGKGLSNKDVADYLRAERRYAEMIVHALHNQARSMSEEDVEEREISWTEEEIAPLVLPLIKGQEVNELAITHEADEKTIREEQAEIISEYMTAYLSGNMPDNPEPDPDAFMETVEEKPESEETEVPRRKVFSRKKDVEEEREKMLEDASRAGFLASVGKTSESMEAARAEGSANRMPDEIPDEEPPEKKGFFGSIKDRFKKKEPVEEENVEEEETDDGSSYEVISKEEETEEEEIVEEEEEPAEEKKGIFQKLRDRFKKDDYEDDGSDDGLVEVESEEETEEEEIVEEEEPQEKESFFKRLFKKKEE